ncbi:hypothetical protein QQP08_022159 [Theobroma cacao]|nr:hypothetical protein QQP08_022159 [Theobroma cacao]
MGVGGRMSVPPSLKKVPCSKLLLTLNQVKKAIPPLCSQCFVLCSFSYLIYDFILVSLFHYVATNYIFSFLTFSFMWLGQFIRQSKHVSVAIIPLVIINGLMTLLALSFTLLFLSLTFLENIAIAVIILTLVPLIEMKSLSQAKNIYYWFATLPSIQRCCCHHLWALPFSISKRADLGCLCLEVPWLVVNVTLTHRCHIMIPQSGIGLGELLTSIDIDYGILNKAFHNLTYTYVAHHLFSTVPHYRTIKATKVIKPVFGRILLV